LILHQLAKALLSHPLLTTRRSNVGSRSTIVPQQRQLLWIIWKHYFTSKSCCHFSRDWRPTIHQLMKFFLRYSRADHSISASEAFSSIIIGDTMLQW